MHIGPEPSLKTTCRAVWQTRAAELTTSSASTCTLTLLHGSSRTAFCLLMMTCRKLSQQLGMESGQGIHMPLNTLYAVNSAFPTDVSSYLPGILNTSLDGRNRWMLFFPLAFQKWHFISRILHFRSRKSLNNNPEALCAQN